MQRFDHPSVRLNPYPDSKTRIKGFRYGSALVLVRLKDAVQLRDGEDADYLTGGPFNCAWQGTDGAWHDVAVPAGLVTDLTSTPRLLRWLVGRVGPWLEAAILHDYLYIAWQDVPGYGARRADRRFADRMMLAAMRAAGVGRVTAWGIYLSVRLLGGATYRGRNADRYVDLCDPLIADQLP